MGFIKPGSLPYKNSDLPRMEVKLFGQWEETIKVTQRMGPAVKESGIIAQTKVAEELVKLVKRHLRNQDLPWKALSRETSARKDHYGADPRILMAWKDYYNNIEVWRIGNQHMVYGGVRKGKRGKQLNGKRSRLDIATIATIHEFSSGRRIPRRPLWNPTIKEMGSSKGIQKIFTTSLIYHLRRAGIPIAQFKNIF